MYSTKEKLRILREINNPEAVGADLALFRQALPADPRLIKFDLSPQRHAEEITLSLLDHYTREEIVANRRNYSKQSDNQDAGGDPTEGLSEEQKKLFKGYSVEKQRQIRKILDETASPQDIPAALQSAGFKKTAQVAEKLNSASQDNSDQGGSGDDDDANEGSGEGSGEGAGDKSDKEEKPAAEAVAGEEAKKKSGKSKSTQE